MRSIHPSRRSFLAASFGALATLGLPSLANAASFKPMAGKPMGTTSAHGAALPTVSALRPADALQSYSDPDQFAKLFFGAHSHWLQPWRSYLETMPASTFIDGLGMNINLDGQDPDLVMRMLALHGISRARIEIAWGLLTYDDETRLTDGDARRLTAELVAAKRNGIRPLILLNSNHGLPCPTRFTAGQVSADVAVGATTIQVTSAAGLEVGYSGLSHLTSFWAAEDLITGVNGTTLSLSKPLPVAFRAGAIVPIQTLKYRPFSVPGSADYQATLLGWSRYVATVAAFVAGVLGTTGAADKGFDMEIWNELTFGCNFLDINNYYATQPYQLDPTTIWHDLVQVTAEVMTSQPALFTGVQVGDGFGNTTPWIAASTEPARIAAIDKHPYPRRVVFPRDEQSGTALNALGFPDSYVPTYSALFPEHYGTGVQTETLVRDMGPSTSLVGKVAHGRNARTKNGGPMPTGTWITEVNLTPNEDDPTIILATALALKAKTTARFAAFYLNKGVSRLFFYGAAGGDAGCGMVSDAFLSYARQQGAPYPADDRAYTTPALAVLQRMVGQFQQQLDRSLVATRPVSVLAIADSHNHSQFHGDGSPEHPPLYDREVLAILPYQVNASRFVIPYYVMTRDVMQPLTPERFNVELEGLRGIGATVSVYDPIGDGPVPVRVLNANANTLSVELTAADYPYLLIVQEAG